MLQLLLQCLLDVSSGCLAHCMLTSLLPFSCKRRANCLQGTPRSAALSCEMAAHLAAALQRYEHDQRPCYLSRQ